MFWILFLYVADFFFSSMNRRSVTQSKIDSTVYFYHWYLFIGYVFVFMMMSIACIVWINRTQRHRGVVCQHLSLCTFIHLHTRSPTNLFTYMQIINYIWSWLKLKSHCFYHPVQGMRNITTIYQNELLFYVEIIL